MTSAASTRTKTWKVSPQVVVFQRAEQEKGMVRVRAQNTQTACKSTRYIPKISQIYTKCPVDTSIFFHRAGIYRGFYGMIAGGLSDWDDSGAQVQTPVGLQVLRFPNPMAWCFISTAVLLQSITTG